MEPGQRKVTLPRPDGSKVSIAYRREAPLSLSLSRREAKGSSFPRLPCNCFSFRGGRGETFETLEGLGCGRPFCGVGGPAVTHELFEGRWALQRPLRPAALA